MKTKRLFVPGLALAVVLMLTAGAASAQAQAKQGAAKPASSGLLGVLEKSGYTYTRVGDGIYEIPATGKNLKEFPLRITQAEDLLLVIAKLADRKDIVVKEAFALKLLEMNDNYDIAKFALSAEMLYARIDIHMRLVDVEELKALVELMAHVVDEVYVEVKPFIKAK